MSNFLIAYSRTLRNITFPSFHTINIQSLHECFPTFFSPLNNKTPLLQLIYEKKLINVAPFTYITLNLGNKNQANNLAETLNIFGIIILLSNDPMPTVLENKPH